MSAKSITGDTRQGENTLCLHLQYKKPVIAITYKREDGTNKQKKKWSNELFSTHGLFKNVNLVPPEFILQRMSPVNIKSFLFYWLKALLNINIIEWYTLLKKIISSKVPARHQCLDIFMSKRTMEVRRYLFLGVHVQKDESVKNSFTDKILFDKWQYFLSY